LSLAVILCSLLLQKLMQRLLRGSESHA